MNTTPRSELTPGGVLGIAGGLVLGLSYLVLPVVTVPLIGSLTAPTLGGEVTGATSLSLLPLAPVLALAAVAVGAWLTLARPAGRAVSIGGFVLLACGVLGALVYLWPFLRLQGELSAIGAESLGLSAATFTGVGFWAALLGAILIGVGGLLTLARARSGARRHVPA